ANSTGMFNFSGSHDGQDGADLSATSLAGIDSSSLVPTALGAVGRNANEGVHQLLNDQRFDAFSAFPPHHINMLHSSSDSVPPAPDSNLSAANSHASLNAILRQPNFLNTHHQMDRVSVLQPMTTTSTAPASLGTFGGPFEISGGSSTNTSFSLPGVNSPTPGRKLPADPRIAATPGRPLPPPSPQTTSTAHRPSPAAAPPSSPLANLPALPHVPPSPLSRHHPQSTPHAASGPTNLPGPPSAVYLPASRTPSVPPTAQSAPTSMLSVNLASPTVRFAPQPTRVIHAASPVTSSAVPLEIITRPKTRPAPLQILAAAGEPSSLGSADAAAGEITETLSPPAKLKRPMNAFLVFSSERRAQYKIESPHISTAEQSKLLGEEWSQMPDERKQLFYQRARDLKTKFTQDHPDFVYTRRPNNTRRTNGSGTAAKAEDGSPKVLGGKRGRDTKPNGAGRKGSGTEVTSPVTPERLKRPMNAYLIFNQDMRRRLLSENPNMTVSEISRSIGDQWRALPDMERQTYNRRAQALKDDFKFKNPDYVFTRRSKKDMALAQAAAAESKAAAAAIAHGDSPHSRRRKRAKPDMPRHPMSA
ncbi:hypothetical protein IWQ60_012558, partial [Tieghemiomyces parasiticus]